MRTVRLGRRRISEYKLQTDFSLEKKKDWDKMFTTVELALVQTGFWLSQSCLSLLSTEIIGSDTKLSEIQFLNIQTSVSEWITW